MSRVGDKLKEVRTKSGISAKVLAKKLGVSEKYILEVESGRRVVQESFIERAGKFLKADLSEISMVVTDTALEKEEKQIKKTEIKEKKINPRTLGETSEV